MIKDNRIHLMLVDNPKLLFKTLCELKNKVIDIDDFKSQLEKNMKMSDEAHIKTIHTYYYTATTYKLLIKSMKKGKKPLYRISSTGQYFCNIYADNNKLKEYQNALKTLLLGNERKGLLYAEFLNYVQRPKSKEQIYEYFQKPTGKTLIAWCLEADLIRKKKNIIGKKHSKKYEHPNMKTFWISLIQSYNDMQWTELFGIKKIYVDIEELNLRVSCELGFEEENMFDTYLHDLLESEYGKFISLDGGPPLLYDDKYYFRYRRKNYLYLSIKNNVDVI